MNEISTMSDRELLEELVRETRLAERRRKTAFWVRLCAAAVLLVLCLIYVPRAVRTVQQYNDAVDRVNALTGQIETLLSGFGDISPEASKEAVDQARQTFRQVQSLLNEYSSFDSAQLRGTLDQLGETAEKMDGFFDSVSGEDLLELQGTLEELNGHLAVLQDFLEIFG